MDERTIEALASSEPDPHTVRSDSDYAIEFGRYLASAAKQFMEAHNNAELARENGNEPDSDEVTDAWRALDSAIYEFKKRAHRVDGGEW